MGAAVGTLDAEGDKFIAKVGLCKICRFYCL